MSALGGGGLGANPLGGGALGLGGGAGGSASQLMNALSGSK